MYIRKVISIILVIILFLSVQPTGFASGFDDIKDNEYKSDIEFLVALGILKGYENANFNPDEEFSKAEFLVAILRGMGDVASFVGEEEVKDDDVPSNENALPFKDVLSHWSASSVKKAYELGVISKSADDKFYPDNKITYGQALEWILNILGYNSVISKRMSDISRLEVATELDVDKGIKLGLTDPIRRDVGSRLINNMLNATMCGYYIKDGEICERPGDSDTMLATYFNLFKVSGILYAVGQFAVNDTQKVSTGKVKIGDTIYDNKAGDILSYLGSYVDAYYKESNEENEIVFVFNHKNFVLEIDAENIVKFDYATNSYVYDQINNGNEDVAEISTTADVIFNQKSVIDFAQDVMVPKIGIVKLIDNDRDGIYDVVNISSVENYYVDVVAYDTSTVYDKNGRSVMIDSTDSSFEKFELTDVQGNAMDMKKINKGDLLSVERSLGDSDVILRACIVRNSVNGTIAETFIDNEKKYVKINDKTYKIDLESVSGSDVQNLRVGTSVVIALDIKDNIAGIEVSTDDFSYAYTIAGGKEDGIDGAVIFKMLMVSSGTIKECSLNNKIYLNGEKMSSKNVLQTSTALSYTSLTEPKLKQQLIKVKVNSQNQITEIKTAKENNLLPLDEYIGHDGQNFSLDYSGVTCYRDPGHLYGKYFLNDSVKILEVPSCNIMQNKYTTDEKYFKMKTWSYFSNSTSYNVNIYDSTKGRIPRIVVINNDANTSQVNVGQSDIIVEKITDAINSDGEAVKKLHGFSNGAPTELVFSNDCEADVKAVNVRIYPQLLDRYEVSDIKQGCIISTSINNANEIQSFRMLFDPDLVYDTDGSLKYSEGSLLTQNAYFVPTSENFAQPVAYAALGKVMEVDFKNAFIFNSHLLDTNHFDMQYNRTFLSKENWTVISVYTFEREGKKVKLGSFEDIYEGGEVFVRGFYGQLVDVVIMK